jgi:hypothetical protein
MELFGERPTDEWSDEFVTFWIQFLSGLGCYFDQKNPVLSIQTTQTAHVIFQHVNLAFLEKYRILHFLRCSDARRSWYWSTAEDSMQNFVHCIAYRNTESLSTSRVLGEFKKTNLLQERVPIHLIFDLIECDRNLMGNIIKFWSNAGSKDKDMASGLISCIAPSIIHRLGRTAFQLVQFLEDKKDTCFHFGWRFRTAKENIDELITDSAGGTVHDQLPVGMREIAWTTEVITRIVEGRQFDLDTFSREFAWVGEVWGGGWHSPFDRLGERGFRAVVFRNSEGNGKHIVMRAGCGMIVFGTIAGPDGRIEAQMQELLWPIPNEKGKTHYGEYAKA